ncbi:MAG: ATP-binding cassette domain-containing protein [Clostridia bacterium]|nr:ATP-binding cassette domain-containing protein [Oscillospiraceae bacterium]MBQ8400773.1 ATP-binding cassette domain-containing protein [Clostridia bacterium]
MVEFKDVSVAFHQNKKTVEAVKKVSLKIETGDVFGIVGGSGAGKSTLLRTINLLQPVTGGDVLVNGKSIVGYKGTKLRELRKGVGMIFQHFNLAENKTVSQNIAFVLKTAGWKKEDIQKRVHELLEFVKLSDKADVYPSKLSGGQKQRVAIARALANHTDILICDEPTSALDAETTASVLELLREVNQKLGVTIIMITHELDVVKSICTRTAVMADGEVVETGDVYEVFTNPQHPFTQQLIGHTQHFDIPEEIRSSISGPVVKLTYLGERAAEAVLSQTAADYNVRYNILHGKIEYIGTRPLGILYVNITGDSSDVEQTINKLAERTYRTEVVFHA